LPQLVTGAAGFIGYHVAERLLADGNEVIGIDDLNPYYDVRLKEARIARLREKPAFRFHQVDLGDRHATTAIFSDTQPEIVFHLAAQAGVRYSLQRPDAYADANLAGFLHVLEGCRATSVRHLVFASSSSVYGASTRMPYREQDPTTHPLSLYAATKIAGEMMAHCYSHLFAIPATGLRLFTVYGPWGRPDMAYYKFARDILDGRPIELFNQGHMIRDFTYVDDVVESVVRVADLPPTGDPNWSSKDPTPGTSAAPWRLLNVGAGKPTDLGRFLEILEDALGRRAIRQDVPMQPGDVESTWADTSALASLTGIREFTALETGIPRFAEWFRDFHGSQYR
jgi:UDP-glucuronate 4-epimerase